MVRFEAEVEGRGGPERVEDEDWGRGGWAGKISRVEEDEVGGGTE